MLASLLPYPIWATVSIGQIIFSNGMKYKWTKAFSMPLITFLYFYHSGREDGGGMTSILIILSYPQVRPSILHTRRKWHRKRALIYPKCSIYVECIPFIHALAVHYVKCKPIIHKKTFKTSQMKNLLKLLLVCKQEWFHTFMDWMILPRRELHYLKASRASMMQQFSTKSFSLNCLTLWHTNSCFFSGPNQSFHLWKMSG